MHIITTSILPIACAASFLLPSAHLHADDAAESQAKALGQSKQNHAAKNSHPDAQWFPAAGLGLFIHWGVISPRASGDLSWCMLANKPWKDDTVTPNTYYATLKSWNPDKMDYDSMLAAAKKAGFQYAVMVTKHHDGFTLWPSAHGDLGTKQHFKGRDFVQEFINTCRKHDLKVGLYYSPPDWWFEREYKSFSYKGPALDMDHKPVTLPKRPADFEARRKALIQGQVTELLKNYGKVDLFWFDGGKGEISNSVLRDLQPGIVINRRNGGNGDYGDSEVQLPKTRFSGWFETCATCWPSKKWAYTEEYGFDSAPMALAKLVMLRAWGGNLLANLGPKGDGSVPEPALQSWKAMGEWMAHSGESVIGTQGGPWPEQANLPITNRNGAAYVHFFPSFPEIYPGNSGDGVKFAKTKDVMPMLPNNTASFVWKNAPKPSKALLLRTNAAVPFQFDDGTLTITLPATMRSDNIDVVKLVLEK